MYIIIMEKGSAYQRYAVSDDDKQACDDGYISIIDADALTEYYNGGWTTLPDWSEIVN